MTLLNFISYCEIRIDSSSAVWTGAFHSKQKQAWPWKFIKTRFKPKSRTNTSGGTKFNDKCKRDAVKDKKQASGGEQVSDRAPAHSESLLYIWAESLSTAAAAPRRLSKLLMLCCPAGWRHRSVCPSAARARLPLPYTQHKRTQTQRKGRALH